MLDKPRVIGVIPARYGSMRLPAKPLVKLLDKPLVQWVYERATKASLLNKVIVATDDERIQKVVNEFGGEAVLTSVEIPSGSDRVAIVAAQVEGDIFVNIQGDEPLISPEMIDEAVTVLLNSSDIEVATLAKQIENADDLFDPNVVKVVLDGRLNAIYFSRSTIPFVRDEPDCKNWIKRHKFYKHIGIYVYRRNFLLNYPSLPKSKLEEVEKLEQLRILEAGYKIGVGITNYESIPVDTQADIKKVEKLLRIK